VKQIQAYFKPKNENAGLWMQSITQKDGTKKRAFCLSCFREGKDWIGGELCQHFQHSQSAGPQATLDPALLANDDPD